MKTNLIGLAVAAAAMVSFSAFAQAPCDTHEAYPINSGYQNTDNRTDGDEDVDNRTWGNEYVDHDDAQPNGRYETRVTQQWVAARYEQVPVQQCQTFHFGHGHQMFHISTGRTVCSTVYETRVVPGHYESVQQQVWVPVIRPPGRVAYREYSRAPAFGRVGFSIGFH